MDAHSLLTPLSSPPFPHILLLIFMKRGNNLQFFPDLLSLSTSSSSLLTAALRVSGITSWVRAEDLKMKKGRSRTTEGRNGRRVKEKGEGGDRREGTERLKQRTKGEKTGQK